jgi:hypothetical protein
MRKFPCVRLYYFISLLIALVCTIGCVRRQSELPKTYPVRGKVTLKNGKPVTDGMVRFEPASTPKATTAGKINSDGTYSLITMSGDKRADGAIPGPNRVILVLSANSGVPVPKGQLIPPPVVFPKPFVVEEKENDIPLTISQ